MMKKLIFYLIFAMVWIFGQSAKTDSLVNLLKTETNDSIKVFLFNELGKDLGSLDANEAQSFVDSALVLSERNGFIWGIIEAKVNYGYILFFKGDYTKSLTYYKDALELAKKISFPKAMSNIYNFGGNLYFRLGKYDLAIENYQNALRINELINNIDGMAANYNGLGIINLRTNDLENAYKYFEKAVDYASLIDNKITQCSGLSNLATILKLQGKYRLSIEKLERVLILAKSINNQILIAKSLHNIGSAHALLGDTNKSIEYFFKALKIKQNIGNKLDIGYSLNNLGEAYRQKGMFDRSIEYLKQAEELAHNIESLELLIHVFRSLSETYYDSGNYKLAHNYLNHYKINSDSLNSVSHKNRIAELEEKYEVETLEKENQVLKTKNELNELKIYYQYWIFIVLTVALTIAVLYGVNHFRGRKRMIILNKKLIIQNDEIRDQKNKLKELNSTKDKIFSIIAHDLKNPFTVFIGFTEIFIEDYNELTDNEKIQFIKDIHSSLKKTYSLLENLLFWARAQKGDIKIEKEEFLIGESVNKIISLHKLNADHKNITIKNLLEENLTVYADVTTMKIVISNLLANAIKFTANGGSVEISSQEVNDKAKITVADNGLGMSENKMNTLFDVSSNISTFGTNNEKGTGIGLPLCKEFVEKNEGKIWVESIEGEGSKFNLTLPLIK